MSFKKSREEEDAKNKRKDKMFFDRFDAPCVRTLVVKSLTCKRKQKELHLYRKSRHLMIIILILGRIRLLFIFYFMLTRW